MTRVSIDHAATLIGVSTATIRNWVKAGHLSAAEVRPISFLEKDIFQLKNQLSSGQVVKLRTRANKSASTTRHTQKSLGDASHSSVIANSILALYNEYHLDISALIYLSAVRIFQLENDINPKDKYLPLGFKSPVIAKRQAVTNFLKNWREKLGETPWSEAYRQVDSIIDRTSDDILGDIYQLLTVEGDKSNKGAYYTPMKIVVDSVDSIQECSAPFIDPCCGSGRYLLSAARRFSLTPSQIFGFDTDAVAVDIAKVNLFLEFPDDDFEPNIWCLDSITQVATGNLICETNSLIGNFGAVATNPPWGSYKNTTKNVLSNNIMSNEAFSLFIEKSLHFLRKSGSLSFILPESILKTKIHCDVRQLILKTTKIRRIVKLGRPFESVYTEVIRLDLINELPTADWMIEVEASGKNISFKQDSFLKSENFILNIGVESVDDAILKKVYSLPHKTLKGNADWALGIVTGNNAKFVNETCAEGMEPVFRGSDVSDFRLGIPKAFLRYEPHLFQQVAKEHIYRAPEKLIYKFISSKLSFAFDEKKCLTLNSANIIIPRIDGVSVRTALAFLNSDVFQYVFKKTFSTHKVLRGDLETMPFPIISSDLDNKIDALVADILCGKSKPDVIQDVVYSVFEITPEEIEIIKLAIGK